MAAEAIQVNLPVERINSRSMCFTKIIGLIVITGAQWLCKPRVGVRFPVGPPVFGLKVFMDARMPVTHEEGDRYPLRPPRMHTVALRYGRKCLWMLDNKPLKLQLEFSQKNIAQTIAVSQERAGSHKPSLEGSNPSTATKQSTVDLASETAQLEETVRFRPIWLLGFDSRDSGLKQYLDSVTAAYQSPKLLVGVRIPVGMPNLLKDTKL